MLWRAPAAAQGLPVDLELVLAVDCSYSVNQSEFDLQMGGIAAAFRDPSLHTALRIAAPNGIAVTLVQWAGGGVQSQAVGWTYVAGAAEAEAFASLVERAGRRLAPGSTGVGSALFASLRLFEDNGFAGTRQVIDISGDGPNNSGIDPDVVRDMAVDRATTINGLPILNEVEYLDHYYRNHVIGGPGAFLVTIDDYDSYPDAMLMKLIREIGADQFAAAE